MLRELGVQIPHLLLRSPPSFPNAMYTARGNASPHSHWRAMVRFGYAFVDTQPHGSISAD